MWCIIALLIPRAGTEEGEKKHQILFLRNAPDRDSMGLSDSKCHRNCEEEPRHAPKAGCGFLIPQLAGSVGFESLLFHQWNNNRGPQREEKIPSFSTDIEISEKFHDECFFLFFSTKKSLKGEQDLVAGQEHRMFSIHEEMPIKLHLCAEMIHHLLGLNRKCGTGALSAGNFKKSEIFLQLLCPT